VDLKYGENGCKCNTLLKMMVKTSIPKPKIKGPNYANQSYSLRIAQNSYLTFIEIRDRSVVIRCPWESNVDE